MRKLIFCLLLTILMVLPVSANNSLNVVVDGQNYHFVSSVVNQDGRLLIPMRPYFEVLGATITWNEETRSVTSIHEGLEITITVDNSNPVINGFELQVDVPAQILDDKTYVPLRFIGETLGYEVVWDHDQQKVVITKCEETKEQLLETLAQKEAEAENKEAKDELVVVSSEVGGASWYGNEFHGRGTASGERFDQYAFTAAHRTLDFGTYVNVTFLRTGKSVIVRINDRGPHIASRIIDLSRGAAEEIGLRSAGLGEVKIEVLAGYVE